MNEKDKHEKLDELLDEFVNILYILQKDQKNEEKLFQKLHVLMNEMNILSKQIGGVLEEHLNILQSQLKNISNHSKNVDSMVEGSLKIKNDLWPL